MSSRRAEPAHERQRHSRPPKSIAAPNRATRREPKEHPGTHDRDHADSARVVLGSATPMRPRRESR